MPQPFFGTTHLPLDVWHVKTTNIFEFDAFEQIPHPFLWIQLRRIGRQALQMDAFSSAMSQEIFDHLTTMNRSTIPDNQQFARDLAGEQLQEANDIWTFIRMVLGLHKHSPSCGKTSHDRKMVTGQLDAQPGRLTNRCIGAYRHGQEIKGRLIDKDYRALFLFSLFFNSGQRCSFQVWMPISSRWLAFWMGFCRLYLIERRRRLQWAG